MQKLLTIVTILVLMNTVANATIRRVGFNSHIPGVDYISLQDANDAATAGDTIYMYPGSDMGARIRKKLIIVGPGYFLDPSDPIYPGNGNLQVFKTSTAASGRFILDAGADGSEVYGCNFETSGDLTVLLGSASNILFKRCRFRSINENSYAAIYLTSGSNKITFQQCVIEGGFFEPADNVYITDLNISNCILRASSSRGYFSFNNSLSSVSGVIQNCIFESQGTKADLGSGSWLIQNCISQAGNFNGQIISYVNNIGTNTQFPAGNGNQQNIIWNSIFQLTGSWDKQYTLIVGGPAIAAGVGGIDCGIFGGGTPYRLSGISPFPTIYALTSPQGPNPPGNTIQIDISTRTNN